MYTSAIKRINISTRFPVLCVLVFTLFSAAFPQTQSNSTLKGIVRDFQGAFVPRAVITLSHDKANFIVTATEYGEYSLSIPPGIYKVHVSPILGFDSAYRSEIKITPNAIRYLNLKVRPKLPISRTYINQGPEILDHPSVQYVSLLSEDVPYLSPTGVRNGMIQFGRKCQSPTGTSYYGISSDDTRLASAARVTFTYDFFTVVADEIRMLSGTKSLYAYGSIELEKENDVSKLFGTFRISVTDGSLTIDKVSDGKGPAL